MVDYCIRNLVTPFVKCCEHVSGRGTVFGLSWQELLSWVPARLFEAFPDFPPFADFDTGDPLIANLVPPPPWPPFEDFDSDDPVPWLIADNAPFLLVDPNQVYDFDDPVLA